MGRGRGIIQVGEYRFVYKCLLCGEEYRLSGLTMGSDALGRILNDRRNTACGMCGAPVVRYTEEMRYDYGDETDYLSSAFEYLQAREAYLLGRWVPPEGYRGRVPVAAESAGPLPWSPMEKYLNGADSAAQWLIRIVTCCVWVFLLGALVSLIYLFIRMYFWDQTGF